MHHTAVYNTTIARSLYNIVISRPSTNIDVVQIE